MLSDHNELKITNEENVQQKTHQMVQELELLQEGRARELDDLSIKHAAKDHDYEKLLADYDELESCKEQARERHEALELKHSPDK